MKTTLKLLTLLTVVLAQTVMGDSQAVTNNVPRATGTTLPRHDNREHSSGNHVHQLNPDVKVVITDPKTPPGILLAQANTGVASTEQATGVQPTESVQTENPEFTVDISKYFQTDFTDIEYERRAVESNYILLLGKKSSQENRKGAHPTLKDTLGKEKTRDLLLKSCVKTIRDETDLIDAFRRGEKFVKPAVAKGERWDLPNGLDEEIELVAKKYIFFYASHNGVDDYGLDADYLTFPVIDEPITDDEVKKGYVFYPLVEQLYLYDKLFNEYDGVTTRGRLGRKLGIDGVKLYNVWEQLKTTGHVENREWSRDNETHKTAKFLQIPANVNVDDMVQELELSIGVKEKLIPYLESLQQGKKMGASFEAKYENLVTQQKKTVLTYNYEVEAYRILADAYNIDKKSQEDYRDYFFPKLNEWIGEYETIASITSSRARELFLQDPEVAPNRYSNFVKHMENIKESFGGEIPFGQEFLFFSFRFNL